VKISAAIEKLERAHTVFNEEVSLHLSTGARRTISSQLTRARETLRARAIRMRAQGLLEEEDDVVANRDAELAPLFIVQAFNNAFKLVREL
jgi:hypothetical protein